MRVGPNQPRLVAVSAVACAMAVLLAQWCAGPARAGEPGAAAAAAGQDGRAELRARCDEALDAAVRSPFGWGGRGGEGDDADTPAAAPGEKGPAKPVPARGPRKAPPIDGRRRRSSACNCTGPASDS